MLGDFVPEKRTVYRCLMTPRLEYSVGVLFPNHVSKTAYQERILSYDGSRTILIEWKAYEVSGVETFASRHIRIKSSQPLVGKEVVSLAYAKCSPDSASRGETFTRSLRRPT